MRKKRIQKDREKDRGAKPTLISLPIVDTVGDIFDDIGKYTQPVDSSSVTSVCALSTSTSKEGHRSLHEPAKLQNSSSSNDAKQSYFMFTYASLLDATEHEQGRSKADVMSTVKALLQNQNVKVGAADSKNRAITGGNNDNNKHKQLVIEEKGKVLDSLCTVSSVFPLYNDCC